MVGHLKGSFCSDPSCHECTCTYSVYIDSKGLFFYYPGSKNERTRVDLIKRDDSFGFLIHKELKNEILDILEKSLKQYQNLFKEIMEANNE